MLSFKPTFSLSSFTFLKKVFSSSSLSAIRVVSSAYLRLLIFLPAILIPACVSSSPEKLKISWTSVANSSMRALPCSYLKIIPHGSGFSFQALNPALSHPSLSMKGSPCSHLCSITKVYYRYSITFSQPASCPSLGATNAF